MAIGDAAAAEGLPLVDGATTAANDIDLELNRTRDLIVTTEAWLKVKAATASATGGTLCMRTSAGIISVGDPTHPAHAANRGYVDTTVTILTNWVDGTKVAKTDVVANATSGPFANLIPKYDSNARVVTNAPAAANHATNKLYVDSALTAARAELQAVIDELKARIAALEAGGD